jgi:hypothetical protein
MMRKVTLAHPNRLPTPHPKGVIRLARHGQPVRLDDQKLLLLLLKSKMLQHNLPRSMQLEPDQRMR